MASGPQDISDHSIRQGNVQWSEEDGRVLLRRQKFGKFGSWWLRRFKVNPILTIKLDALGSAAWHLMDGRKVRELVDALEAQFPDEGRLDERFGLYMQRLVGGGMVDLTPPSLKR